jgi:hypothetical protein
MLNPSELHGASTGLLATGMAHDTDEQKTAALGLLEKALAVDLHGESGRTLRLVCWQRHYRQLEIPTLHLALCFLMTMKPLKYD